MQRTGVGGLNYAVHARLSRSPRSFEQRAQQAGSNAARPKQGQQHERKLGLAIFRDIFAMAQHGAIVGKRQDRHALALIEQVKAAQQRLIGRLTVRKVALVEAFAIHRREKSCNPLAILRNRPAQ